MPEGELPKMEFQEEPLLYPEAIAALREFERVYHVDSENLFGALERGESVIEIDPDDLYEWRSYFEFAKEVEFRVDQFLAEAPDELEEVVYSPSVGNEPTRNVKRPRDQRALALAA